VISLIYIGSINLCVLSLVPVTPGKSTVTTSPGENVTN
jgi:hypothetical protein